MSAIRARLSAIVAAFLLARVTHWSIVEVTPELAAALERWVSYTFELLLLFGYAVVHPWLQRRHERVLSESKQISELGR